MRTSLGVHYSADRWHVGEFGGKKVEARGFLFLYGQKPVGNKETRILSFGLDSACKGNHLLGVDW